jgi:hypothetical protein
MAADDAFMPVWADGEDVGAEGGEVRRCQYGGAELTGLLPR